MSGSEDVIGWISGRMPKDADAISWNLAEWRPKLAFLSLPDGSARLLTDDEMREWFPSDGLDA